MKYTLIFTVIFISLTQSLKAQQSKDDRTECPVHQVTDLVFINFILEHSEYKYAIEELVPRSKQVAMSESAKSDFEAFERYYSSMNISAVTDHNTCSQINSAIQTIDHEEITDPESFRFVYYHFDESYGVLGLSRDLSKSRGLSLITLDSTFSILEKLSIR